MSNRGKILTQAGKLVDVDDLAESGGSQPVMETALAASQVPIADQNSGFLTWTPELSAGLLDYTDPAAPVVTEAGCYAVTVEANPSDADVDVGLFTLTLTFQRAGEDVWPNVSQSVPLGLTCCAVALTGVLAAGDTITAIVVNLAGDESTVSFGISAATIVKIR